jgi:folate-dependent phosphoribosylglycinamide formyltransferase PurN
MEKQKLIVLASGTKDGKGGSNLMKLREHFRPDHRHGEIVGVVSHRQNGAVLAYAREQSIPNKFIPASELTPEMYSEIPCMFDAPDAWVVLAGWLPFVCLRRTDKLGLVLDKIGKNYGLDPARTVGTHPALLSDLNGRFAGKGMWDMRVHQAVHKALEAGEIEFTGFTFFFVGRGIDKGAIIREIRTPIHVGMTAEDIQRAVKKMEHRWLSIFVEMVVRRQIRLENGIVVAPRGFNLLVK